MRLLPEPGLISLFALGAIACFSTAARADAKGDELLRQVKTAVHALEPLVGEYTVTAHDKAGDKVSKCRQISAFNRKGWQGSRDLPQSVFNLFDPITQVPATTRYVGRQTVEGQTYNVVELKLPVCILQLFLGDDNLIHRARTTLGATPPIPAFPVDPKTGKLLPPTHGLDTQVKPASGADANAIDVVVTSYHKVRAFPPRPPLAVSARTPPRAEANRFPLRFALSPHGERLAIAYNDKSLAIRNSDGDKTGVILENAPGDIAAMAFSPDGLRFAAASRQGVGAIWDAATGRQRFLLSGEHGHIAVLSFAPDGKTLAGASQEGSVFRWDAQTGQPLTTLQESGTRAIAFTADGQILVTLSDRPNGKPGALTLWDIAAGKPIHTEEFATGYALQLACSPDGRWIAASQQEGGIMILDGKTGAKRQTLPPVGGHISALRFAADSKTLIALDQDERGDQPSYRPGVTLWNTDTWQILHAYSLASVGAFSVPDMVSLSADGYTFAMLNTFGRQPNIWTLPNN